MTIPQEEEVVIKTLNVVGVSEDGEEVELTKSAERNLTLKDYLDLENRLVRILFITLTDIFHTTPRLKKHIYKVPPKVKKIIETIEVKKGGQGEKTIKCKLVYNVNTTINLVKVTEL